MTRKWPRKHECVKLIQTAPRKHDCLSSTRSFTLSGLIKRSFSLAGHRTSVALEPEFWQALLQMAQARGQACPPWWRRPTPSRPTAAGFRTAGHGTLAESSLRCAWIERGPDRDPCFPRLNPRYP